MYRHTALQNNTGYSIYLKKYLQLFAAVTLSRAWLSG